MPKTSQATLRGFGKQIRGLAGSGALALITLGAPLSAGAQTIAGLQASGSFGNREGGDGLASTLCPFFGDDRVMVSGAGEPLQELQHLDQQDVRPAAHGRMPGAVGRGEGASTTDGSVPAKPGSLARAL